MSISLTVDTNYGRFIYIYRTDRIAAQKLNPRAVELDTSSCSAFIEPYKSTLIDRIVVPKMIRSTVAETAATPVGL